MHARLQRLAVEHVTTARTVKFLKGTSAEDAQKEEICSFRGPHAVTALEGNFPLENHHLGTGARLLGSVFKTMNPDSFEGSNCVSAGEGSRTHSLF